MLTLKAWKCILLLGLMLTSLAICRPVGGQNSWSHSRTEETEADSPAATLLNAASQDPKKDHVRAQAFRIPQSHTQLVETTSRDWLGVTESSTQPYRPALALRTRTHIKGHVPNENPSVLESGSQPVRDPSLTIPETVQYLDNGQVLPEYLAEIPLTPVSMRKSENRNDAFLYPKESELYELRKEVNQNVFGGKLKWVEM